MRFHEIINEGKVHQLDTGYGGNVRMTLIYQNPSPVQAQTMAQNQMDRYNGLLYLRGIMSNGSTVYVADGWACTHDDLMQNFFPGKSESDERFTTFEIANYAGGSYGADRTTFPAKVGTVKAGHFDVESNPQIAKIIAGCRAATAG